MAMETWRVRIVDWVHEGGGMRNSLRKTMIFLLFFFACATAHAVALTEGNRIGQVVSYDDGSRVEVSCNKNEECQIFVLVNRRKFKITSDDLGKGIAILPSQAALMRDHGSNGYAYSLWFEVGCDTYAEKPPIFICIGSLDMTGDKVDGFHVFKRYISNDFREEAGVQ